LLVAQYPLILHHNVKGLRLRPRERCNSRSLKQRNIASIRVKYLTICRELNISNVQGRAYKRAAPCRRLPQPYCLVPRCRRDQLPVWREGHRRDPVGMALQCAATGVPVCFFYRQHLNPLWHLVYKSLLYQTPLWCKHDCRAIYLQRRICKDRLEPQHKPLSVMKKGCEKACRWLDFTSAEH
jgi:hypothetical protein